jgi:hypothetical protein
VLSLKKHIKTIKMNTVRKNIAAISLICLFLSFSCTVTHAAMGPLKVHPTNSRYFADGNGNAVYLTGSHVWYNLQDRGNTNPPPAFDYNRYLNFLKNHNHNFIRLWTWELTSASAKVCPEDIGLQNRGFALALALL